MTNTIYPATLLCDFYKVNHREQYPENTEVIYSTFTPRSNKYFPLTDKVVVFGIQSFVKKYLIGYFNEHFFKRDKEDVLKEYERLVKYSLGVESPDSKHIAELHDLGYLPVEIKALKEGTLAPVQVPVMTIKNTKPQFFWITNYLETLISTLIWQPMTSATIAHEYRKILDGYAMETVGSLDGVDFQAHDFSMRGLSSLESACLSSAGHMTSFSGCETIPAIFFLEEYYNANVEKEIVGGGIPATEHSVMSAMTEADGDRDEYKAYKRLLTEVYPDGFVSIVSDTYDFWRNVETVLPSLKDVIMNRDGKFVVRPDSGDPVEILCGKTFTDLSEDEWIKSEEDLRDTMEEIVLDQLREETSHGEYGGEGYGEFKYNDKYYKVSVEPFWNRYDKQYYYIDGVESVDIQEFTPNVSDLGLIEALWNIFGGTVSEKGYKLLDSHIGAIYGDSITLERANEILKRLKVKGFASTNVVLGVGSYSYQYNTRDTFGFAMKATYAKINGEERMLFKDPKTDQGKRSQRGMVYVQKGVEGDLFYRDGLNKMGHEAMCKTSPDKLEKIFENGKLLRDESLSEIRNRLKNY